MDTTNTTRVLDLGPEMMPRTAAYLRAVDREMDMWQAFRDGRCTEAQLDAAIDATLAAHAAEVR